MTKVCKDCNRELPIEEFYKHKEMIGGHLNKCKDCVKKRVSNYRKAHINKIRECDRARGKLPKRKRQSLATGRRRRSAVKGYTAAHNKVTRAVAKGLLKRGQECAHCGDTRNIEGHHNDYLKPLEVVWLCSPCHKMLHMGKSEEAELIRHKFATA